MNICFSAWYANSIMCLRGATDKLNYIFSASYDDEDSYLQENGNRRVLLNLASNARLTKNLTFELTGKYHV